VVTRGYPTELIMDILGKILGFVLERAIGYLVDFISVDYTGWLLTMLQITMARTCSTHNVTIIG
jgi:RNase P/RNase MRP subunit p30